jgi:hypothetical protein
MGNFQNSKSKVCDSVENSEKNQNESLKSKSKIEYNNSQSISLGTLKKSATPSTKKSNRKSDIVASNDNSTVNYMWCSMKKRDFITEFKSHADDIYDLDEWRALDDDRDHSSDYIYHYTSYNNAKKCLREKLIRMEHHTKLDQLNNNEEEIPNGVVLTCLRPEYNDSVLLRANLRSDTENHQSKIKCVFAFKKNMFKSKPVKLNDRYGRNTWIYEKDIDLSSKQFKIILRTFLYDNVKAK